MSGVHLRVVPPAPPSSRAECVDGPRPCAFQGCRHHIQHGESQPLSTRETCSLDLADRGGMTLGEVGDVFGISREGVRQIEVKAIRKLRDIDPELADAFLDITKPEGPTFEDWSIQYRKTERAPSASQTRLIRTIEVVTDVVADRVDCEVTG